MMAATHPALVGWENFYVIVGSSAAALIGLQFVVIAIVKDTRTRTASGTLSAFATPTVVHLGGALVISAIMSAPWQTLSGMSRTLTICGFIALGYAATVIIHAFRQTGYRPVWEDWLWHIVLPSCVYVALTVAAITLSRHSGPALFVIGGAALGLLLISIHNAWDTVTYLVLAARNEGGGEE
jgi:hypothetical protein